MMDSPPPATCTGSTPSAGGPAGNPAPVGLVVTNDRFDLIWRSQQYCFFTPETVRDLATIHARLVRHHANSGVRGVVARTAARPQWRDVPLPQPPYADPIQFNLLADYKEVPAAPATAVDVTLHYIAPTLVLWTVAPPGRSSLLAETVAMNDLAALVGWLRTHRPLTPASTPVPKAAGDAPGPPPATGPGSRALLVVRGKDLQIVARYPPAADAADVGTSLQALMRPAQRAAFQPNALGNRPPTELYVPALATASATAPEGKSAPDPTHGAHTVYMAKCVPLADGYMVVMEHVRAVPLGATALGGTSHTAAATNRVVESAPVARPPLPPRTAATAGSLTVTAHDTACVDNDNDADGNARSRDRGPDSRVPRPAPPAGRRIAPASTVAPLPAHAHVVHPPARARSGNDTLPPIGTALDRQPPLRPRLVGGGRPNGGTTDNHQRDAAAAAAAAAQRATPSALPPPPGATRLPALRPPPAERRPAPGPPRAAAAPHPHPHHHGSTDLDDDWARVPPSTWPTDASSALPPTPLDPYWSAPTAAAPASWTAPTAPHGDPYAWDPWAHPHAYARHDRAHARHDWPPPPPPPSVPAHTHAWRSADPFDAHHSWHAAAARPALHVVDDRAWMPAARYEDRARESASAIPPSPWLDRSTHVPEPVARDDPRAPPQPKRSVAAPPPPPPPPVDDPAPDPSWHPDAAAHHHHYYPSAPPPPPPEAAYEYGHHHHHHPPPPPPPWGWDAGYPPTPYGAPYGAPPPLPPPPPTAADWNTWYRDVPPPPPPPPPHAEPAAADPSPMPAGAALHVTAPAWPDAARPPPPAPPAVAAERATATSPPPPPAAPASAAIAPASARARKKRPAGETPPSSATKRAATLPAPAACARCGVTSSPEWRRGPLGDRTLCNACGLKYYREKKHREKARNLERRAAELREYHAQQARAAAQAAQQAARGGGEGGEGGEGGGDGNGGAGGAGAPM
ncbi:hypothetical protein GGF31_001706 [Allomyces arbusculus]|nr:hypothetical protein GGF31_001706 [Allomyces arbusculus]